MIRYSDRTESESKREVKVWKESARKEGSLSHRKLDQVAFLFQTFPFRLITSSTTIIVTLQQNNTMDLRTQILGNPLSLRKMKPQQLIDDRELALRPARPS